MEKSFSTIELIISISIMIILGGMFFLNYGLQRDRMALDNAVSSVVQSIRKAQGLALGQVARPSGTTSSEGSTSCSNVGETATNFGVLFRTNENKIHLVADKDTSNECYFESRYFSSRIYISSLNPNLSNNAWITFERSTLKVKINNSTPTQLQITLCIRGQTCSASNIKTITVNNKGLIEY